MDNAQRLAVQIQREFDTKKRKNRESLLEDMQNFILGKDSEAFVVFNHDASGGKEGSFLVSSRFAPPFEGVDTFYRQKSGLFFANTAGFHVVGHARNRKDNASIYVCIPLSDRYTSKMSQSLGAHVFLYSLDGLLHAASIRKPIQHSANIVSNARLIAMAQRGATVEQIQTHADQSWMAAYGLLLSSDSKTVGAMAIALSRADVIRAKASSRVLLTVLALAMAVLCMLIGFIVTRSISLPVKALTHGTMQIQARNFDYKVHTEARDELGTLAKSFNEMASGLKEGEFVKSTFQKYVSRSVVDQLIDNPDLVKLGGERKRLSIFFSDIRGFTSMSEKMEPEEVVGLLNEYLTKMTEIIFEFSGTLDKFIGDAIMAIWGAPVDQPDHAERAVLAAIKMQEAISELQKKWEKEGQKVIHIGMGVNTGDVVVGNMGANIRMDYTSIGDDVNLAARLEENAKGEQILISHPTYERVQDLVEVKELEPLKVKGKEKTIKVYEVHGLKNPPPPRLAELQERFAMEIREMQEMQEK